ncbi:MAG: alanine--glyoxylate aminotransferase family protein [Ignavibacteria bacterium]|nr:alanine--glyoxylate aminotransferase family protein [Ignavibacteria bacterium]
MNLFTPGPVNIPQRIAEVMSRQPLHHRSSEFIDLSKRIWSGLADIFMTDGMVTVLGGSGMTGIEACIASLHQKGDTIVAVNNGRFGERIAAVARMYGINVVEVLVEWGKSVDVDELADVINNIYDVSALWIVHSETSTGVLQDLHVIAERVQSINPSVLLCVDAISSIAIHEFRMTQWDVDVAVTGIQKGLMCPPGVACCALSMRAVERVKSHDAHTYTMNLKTIIDQQQRGLFTWTPPVTLLAALHEAIEMINQEGIEQVWSRHNLVAGSIRSGLLERGFPLFGEATSNALVCAATDHPDEIIRDLLQKHSIVIVGGQESLQGKIFRIGTCGNRSMADVEVFFNAFDEVIKSIKTEA